MSKLINSCNTFYQRNFSDRNSNRALTCESLEDGDVLETLEVVDEDIRDPEIVEELQTDRVPELWLYRVVRPDPATSLVMRTDVFKHTAGCCQIAPPDLCSKWGGDFHVIQLHLSIYI